MNEVAVTSHEITSDEIDAMSSKRLHQFVLENDIDSLPDYFIDLKPGEKKQAVKSVLFGGDMPKHIPDKGKPAKKAASKKAPVGVKASKAKGTAVAIAPKTGEVLPPVTAFDLPEITFSDITTETQAVEVAKQMVEVGDYALFHLGGIFCRMADQKWFMGYSDFKECCEAEFGVRYRKAAYLMKIYRTIDEKGIAWQDVVKCGWTKLKELLPILTPGNAKKWAEKAQGMSTVALIEHVNAAQKKSGETPKTVQTKTFTLYEDQKVIVNAALADAKLKGSTDFDAVALELICQEYLGSTGLLMPDKIVLTFFKSMAGSKEGLERVIGLMNDYFPDVTVELDIPETYGM